MCRIDSLTEQLGVARLGEMGFEISPDSADTLRGRADPVSGESVSNVFGPLLHYTTSDVLPLIRETGVGKSGVWLSPSLYSSCLAPYRLGLSSPVNVCLIVDVSEVPALWGPGMARRGAHLWMGGGIEFYCEEAIPFSKVRACCAIQGCGDAA